MIQTDFAWTDPLNLLLAAAALALLAVQLGLVYTRHRHSRRFGIRLALNVLLWMIVVAWMLDPSVQTMRNRQVAVLVAENVPAEVSRQLRDSLPDASVISASEIRESDPDTLVLLGQAFDDAILARIAQLPQMPDLQWVPYFQPGEFQHLHWNGTVKKGEMQRIEGEINAQLGQRLKVSYAGRTLDSTRLKAGINRIRLEFPAFSEGRMAVALQLDGRTSDTVRFFAQPEPRLTVRFLLDNPDFETRNLATWLGKNGHSVIYDAGLSTNIRSQVNINKAAAPDLLITSADKASQAAVKKVLGDGKSVLFLQPGNLPEAVKAINHALGTRFAVERISNDESVAVSPELSALPFRFVPRSFQNRAAHYPLAVEQVNGKIGISLLNETFPLQLSGDSLGYAKVWNEILAWTRPAIGPFTSVATPVFRGVAATVHLNDFRQLPTWLQTGADTAYVTASPLNARSGIATWRPSESGWQALHDSLGTEVYIEGGSHLQQAARMRQFVQGFSKAGQTADQPATTFRKLSPWLWFSLIVILLTALWIEPMLPIGTDSTKNPIVPR